MTLIKHYTKKESDFPPKSLALSISNTKHYNEKESNSEKDFLQKKNLYILIIRNQKSIF